MRRRQPSTPWAWIHAVALALALGAGPLLPGQAEADLLGRLAGEAAPAGARALGRAEAIAAARAIPARVVHAELVQGELVLRALHGGVDATLGGGEDLGARLRAALDTGLGTGERPGVITLTQETAQALGPRLDLLAAQAEVRILQRGLPPLRLVRLQPPGQPPRHFLALAPGLVAPVEARLPAGLPALLGAGLQREAVSAAPLFSRTDVETFATLAQAAGDRLLDIAPLLDDPARAAGPLQGRVVVVIGHVEGDGFAIRDAAGALERRVPFTRIEALASRADAALLLSVGCSCYAAGSSSGFLRPVTDLEVARALRGALEARTQAEFLGLLGTPENPFVVSEAVLGRMADTAAAEVLRFRRFETPANGAALSIRLAARDAAAGPAMARTGVQAWYAIGAAGLLLMFRLNRAGFLARFPVLPHATLAPGRHRLGLLLREAMFWPLAPVVGGFVVLVVLLGGWRFRAGLHRFGWTLFFAPFGFFSELGYHLLTMLVCFGPFSAAVAGSIALLVLAIERQAAWQAAAVVLIGGGAAFWSYARLPELAAVRLGRFCAHHPRVARASGLALLVALVAGGLAGATR